MGAVGSLRPNRPGDTSGCPGDDTPRNPHISCAVGPASRTTCVATGGCAIGQWALSASASTRHQHPSIAVINAVINAVREMMAGAAETYMLTAMQERSVCDIWGDDAPKGYRVFVRGGRVLASCAALWAAGPAGD